MAQGNIDYEIWTRFVEADYLIDAKTYEGKCPTCNSPRDCNNYYCLQCKLGGLCPMTFRGNEAHTHHRWLQVRRQSHKSAVDPEELANYLPQESTKHIQKCLLNTGSLCYLRTDHHHQQQASASSSRPPAKRAKCGGRGQPSPLKSCEACRKAIANSQDCKEDFLLCSVECLITLARRQPGRNLLRMLDGALAPTNEFPRTALEKIKGRLTTTTTTTTTGSSSKSGSKALVVIEYRSGRGSSSGGGGGNVATPAAAIHGSSGRRSAPVNYRELHRGGTAGTAPGCSRTAAATGSRGTRAGATTAARTRDSSGGPSSRRAPASRTQAAQDYSASPLGYQRAGIHNLVAEVKDNGDWDRYLGNLGRD